jgi:CO/xanthine dehydrogenase FAD-binding subunit
MTTALAPDEIIVAVRFPKAAAGERHAYVQFSRRTGDFAIVAVACVLLDRKLRIGIGAAEDKPLVFDFPKEEPEAIAAKVRDAVNPAENPRIPALYRKELVEVLTRRAVQKCLSSS